MDYPPETKWENIEIKGSEIEDAKYVGDNHMLLDTVHGPLELKGFAVTKLFRMTGAYKSIFDKEMEEDGACPNTNAKFLEMLHMRKDNNPLIFRRLKDTGDIMSVVGSSYVPIDMEELEHYAEEIMIQEGVTQVDSMRYKTTYPRGYDVTRYVIKDNVSDGEVGDIISTGLQIKNNEYGTRSITVSLYFERLECENGMVSYKTEESITETHLGNKEELLEEFTIKVGEILDNAWNVLESIDRAKSILVTKEEANNLIDHYVLEKKMSGKIATEVKKRINDRMHGAHADNLWGIINAITSVSSHDASHGVKDTLEHIASDMLDIQEKEQLQDKFVEVEDENIKKNIKVKIE